MLKRRMNYAPAAAMVDIETQFKTGLKASHVPCESYSSMVDSFVRYYENTHLVQVAQWKGEFTPPLPDHDFIVFDD